MTKKKPQGEAQKEKAKNLKETLANIRKAYGADSIMILDDEEGALAIERITTGIYPLDVITGGGYPKGRIVEIYGPESSGKTTVALTAIAAAQKLGLQCGFIDMEHALDPVYATSIGVNLKELILSQPDNGEMAIDITDSLASSGEVALLVVDSVAALTPQAELDGDVGDQNIGLLARLMSRSMRRLFLTAANSQAVIIFINQIREKVNGGYGNPETTPGGRALKFYASIRLDVRKGEKISEKGEAIGNVTTVKTAKNKTFPPFKKCQFNIMFGKGVDVAGALIDAAISKGVVEQAGAWFNYNGQRFQGRAAVVDFFRNDEKEFRELERKMQPEGN